MKCHAFQITLDGISEFCDDDVDRIYEAGCDDSTPLSRDGVSYVMFDRDADSFLEAVSTAVRDIGRAGLSARVARVDADDPADQPTVEAVNSLLQAGRLPAAAVGGVTVREM